MELHLRELSMALGVFVSAACGGGGSPGGFDGGVPGDKPINQLTPAETQTICGNLEGTFLSASFLDERCQAEAIALVIEFDTNATDSQLPTDCVRAHASCQTQAGMGADGGAAATCAPFGATCTATVNQLSACVDEFLATFRALDVPVCDQLTRAKVDAVQAATTVNPTTGPACQAYAAACPDAKISTIARL
jgi:hypothetical protein